MLEVNSDGYVVDNGYPQVASDLNELLAPLPGYDTLTDPMKAHALAMSQVPDAAGVWPGQPDYVPTYDIYWAAINLVGFLAAQPVIRSSSSEGTSISVDAPDWGALLAYYRGMSTIAQANASGPILSVLPIPGGPHVDRVDMSGRYDSYGDVDTDLA